MHEDAHNLHGHADTTDPAVEAAQRALNTDRLRSDPIDAFTLAGAREALAPIRELHKPFVDECHCCRHCVECGAIGTGWPCDTARLIYTSEELNDE